MVSKKQSAFVQQGPKPDGIGALVPTVCLAVLFALVASWFQMRIVDLEKNNQSQRIAQTIQVSFTFARFVILNFPDVGGLVSGPYFLSVTLKLASLQGLVIFNMS